MNFQRQDEEVFDWIDDYNVDTDRAHEKVQEAMVSNPNTHR